MSEEKKIASPIKVPRKDPPPRKEEETFEERENRREQLGESQARKIKEEKKNKELSEEDLELKRKLETLVEELQTGGEPNSKPHLEILSNEIKSSTSSMTSVPKPLKFLRPLWSTLRQIHTSWPDTANRKLLSDILSVVGMTTSEENDRFTLRYKLIGTESLSEWGHEYVRHLTAEIAEEHEIRMENKSSVEDLMTLVDKIIPFLMKSNAEHEAVDLLIEIEQLDKIRPFVDKHNYPRVGLYLTQCANYVPEPDDSIILKLAMDIYLQMENFPQALRIAMRLNDPTLIRKVFESPKDELMKKQLCFMLGRQHIFFEETDDLDFDFVDILSNSSLSENFLNLAQDLDIMEPKMPEDVYKTASENKGFSTNVDSARANLASTFVNAFVNAGFGQDKLMTEEGNKWIHKNRETGMMSATASLGMVLLWDVDGGLTQIDKFSYSNEDYIKGGSLLAIGIVNCGIRSDVDPAKALLQESVHSPALAKRIGALLGLGLAYAGTARSDLADLIIPVIEDQSASMEIVGFAALSLGLIFVGTCHPDVSQCLTACLMERDDSSLNVTHSRFVALALGLLFLAKQTECELTLEALKTVTHPIGRYALAAVESCAYCGTGNVLKVQKLLDSVGDHLDQKDKNTYQAVQVLGIALIAMGEEIGTDMALRSFEHLLQYGEPVIRRAVPLAMGLLSISNPRITLMDLLNKLSHDNDVEVAYSAIFALGLIGAGTNNARVAGLLRNLASYYAKEADHLFLVRVAQGFVYMGKGTISLAPFHSERFLLSPVAIAGILSVLHGCLDFKNIILSKNHYLLYCLVTAMHPRLMMTLNEDLKPLSVSVRVGQAVDVIGQAGKPKTITGFQTHTSPVLLGYNDRAELATEEYLPLTDILEGFVILKKNPDYVPEEETKKSKEEK